MRVAPGDEVDKAPQLGKRRSHSDMGIPALWAILTRIAKVIGEKGAHATKVLGMPGCPKRGDAHITVTAEKIGERNEPSVSLRNGEGKGRRVYRSASFTRRIFLPFRSVFCHFFPTAEPNLRLRDSVRMPF